MEKKMRNAESIEFSYEGEFDASCVQEFEEGNLPKVLNHRGKEVYVQPALLSVRAEENKLFARAHVNSSGTTISPFLIFASLLKKDLEEVRQLNLTKVDISYE